MALTEKQVKNIHNLSFTDASQVFDELIERLGIVSQSKYIKVTGYDKSRQMLRLDMISGKISFKEIGKIRFPIINSE